VCVRCCAPCFFRLSIHSSTYLPAMAAERVNSVTSSYQRWLSATPIFPAKMYGNATLGANGFANKLFLAFLFSDTNVGAQLTKHVGFLRSSILWWKCGSQMYGVSIIIVTTVSDGHVGGSYLFPHDLLSPQSRTVHGFSRVTHKHGGYFPHVKQRSPRNLPHCPTRASARLRNNC
jgi:hypothetical protein